MAKTVKVTDTEAFRDAVALLRHSGFYKVSEKETRVETGGIRWGDALFEPAEDDGVSDAEEERKPRGLQERFRSLYERKNREDNSWAVFLEGLVSAFYQKYSLLVYEPITSEEAADAYVGKILKALRALNGNPDADYRAEKTDGSAEKICIAEVKLRLDLGGAPIPSVVPFYFKLKEDGKYVEPLPPARSRALNRQITALAKKTRRSPDGDASRVEPDGDYGALVAAVTSSLRETLLASEGFGDRLILEGDARKKVAEYVLEQRRLASGAGEAEKFLKKARDTGLNPEEEDALVADAGDVEFRASGAQLRYIAILDCYCPAYVVTDRNDPDRRPLFRIEFDLAWKPDIFCARCGEPLVKEGVFWVDGRGFKIDPVSDGALFTDEETAYLTEHGTEFGLHARKKTCEWSGGRCEELVCVGELVRCDRCEDKEFAFCKRCPHPEVVFPVEENGETVPYHTEHLVYCRDAFSLLPEERTERCRICGRVYSKDYLAGSDGVCGFCAPLFRGAGDARYRKLFRLHKNMLPYLKRFGKKNFINEDDSMILFRSGEKLYRLDKSKLGKKGALSLERVTPGKKKTEVRNGGSK